MPFIEPEKEMHANRLAILEGKRKPSDYYPKDLPELTPEQKQRIRDALSGDTYFGEPHENAKKDTETGRQ